MIKILNVVRNILGGIVVMIGAVFFQIGYRFMTERFQDEFAAKMVESFQRALKS